MSKITPSNSQKSLPLFDIIKRGQCLPKSVSCGKVDGGAEVGGAEDAGAQAANGGPKVGSG